MEKKDKETLSTELSALLKSATCDDLELFIIIVEGYLRKKHN